MSVPTMVVLGLAAGKEVLEFVDEEFLSSTSVKSWEPGEETYVMSQLRNDLEVL